LSLHLARATRSLQLSGALLLLWSAGCNLYEGRSLDLFPPAGDVLVECRVSSDCERDRPYCAGGSCVRCLLDANCDRRHPACVGNACVECRSADMARKEWLAGLIAYNLIRWTMCGAAALAKVPVPSLSFSRARQLLLGWCLRHSKRPHQIHAWKQLLKRIAKARLPKRRKTRPPEPRALRYFRKALPCLNGSRATARLQLAKSNAKS